MEEPGLPQSLGLMHNILEDDGRMTDGVMIFPLSEWIIQGQVDEPTLPS